MTSNLKNTQTDVTKTVKKILAQEMVNSDVEKEKVADEKTKAKEAEV